MTKHLATEEGRYSCNGSITATQEKLTKNHNEVDCLNCKDIMKRTKEMKNNGSE